MKILSNHTSPETAYLVEDYPYGFRLRCKIRYWLESDPKRGTRFMSQTSNPKKGNIWNKPKASIYAQFGGCMILDENDHCTWTGISEYTNHSEAITWFETYKDGIPDSIRPLTEIWIKKIIAYDKAKASVAP